MKKLLIIPFLLLTLFVSMNNVKADEITDVVLTEYYSGNNRDYLSEYVLDRQNNSSLLSDVVNYYNQNFIQQYPYFILRKSNYQTENCYSLYGFENTISLDIKVTNLTYDSFPQVEIEYAIPSNSLYINNCNLNNTVTYDILSNNGYAGVYAGPDISVGRQAIISSNFDLIINSIEDNYDNNYTLTFPSITSSSVYPSLSTFTVNVGSNFPTYEDLLDGSYVPSVNYTEINLNNYSYVALALKNYNQDSFDTTFMVKGQLCLTPVYSYGMKNKSDYYSGYQVQGCSPVYNTSTPVKVSILSQDINNNAIYYLKAYNTSIDNIVKVDTNIFDISYITSVNASNPSVIVGGRSYPTIPYNELTSSSTVSEEEGYISGESQNVFDITSDSNYITNLFANPLQALQSVWVSIVAFFNLIATFIGLLPAPLSTFLYSSFALCFILGALKMIL